LPRGSRLGAPDPSAATPGFRKPRNRLSRLKKAIPDTD
jgi:hypothetical protein